MSSKAIHVMNDWCNNHGHTVNISLKMTCRYDRENVISDSFLTISEWQDFLECDAVLIFGTWGSTHPDRQIDFDAPDFDIKSIKRQAYLEYLNKNIVDLCEKYSKPVIVIETATLSRIRQNYVDEWHFKGLKPRYYRIGINHWTWSRTIWCDDSMDHGKRNETFRKSCNHFENIDLRSNKWQWRFNKNGDVYVIAGLEHDPTSNMSVDYWIQKTVSTLLDNTKRNIVVRPHPLSSLDYDLILEPFPANRVSYTSKEEQLPIRDTAKNMYAAVLDSSTSVFELIDLGIPVYCTEHSFAAPFGNTDLTKIEKPILKDKKFYSQWFKQMCYTEFTITEYADGTVFRFIRKLLDKYYNQ